MLLASMILRCLR